jgi:hypothetical protein
VFQLLAGSAIEPRIYTGTLRDKHGKAVEIEGLWGLRFGNGILDQPTDTLFFSAGPDDEAHGVYGKIEPAARR